MLRFISTHIEVSAYHDIQINQAEELVEDLTNESSTLTGRIDMIFHRGDFTPLSITVVGNREEDRTPSGLWPSDHAGVAATLTLP